MRNWHFIAGGSLLAFILLSTSARGEIAAIPTPLYCEGHRLYNAKRYDEAKFPLLQTITQSPRCSPCHLLLGKTYGRMAEQANWLSAVNLARKTLKHFNAAVDISPNWPLAIEDLLRFQHDAPSIVGGSDEELIAKLDKRLLAIDQGKMEAENITLPECESQAANKH
ncbi:MAG: hypothetical protein ACYYK0_05925 [Candidatus Eutrophobiaceae bacterium]